MAVEGRSSDAIPVCDGYTSLASDGERGHIFAVAGIIPLRCACGIDMFHVGGYYGGADL